MLMMCLAMVVLLGATLDRMSMALVVNQPVHFEKGTLWWKENMALVLVLAIEAFIFFVIPVLPSWCRSRPLRLTSWLQLLHWH